MSLETFNFRFTRAYRIAGAIFGVTPKNATVTVTDTDLKVKFGPWHLETPLTNVVEARPTGPFSYAKTAGPAHLSFKDRGVTFATNGDVGLCVRFREPVPGIDPGGAIKHPGMTVTVDDIERLEKALVG